MNFAYLYTFLQTCLLELPFYALFLRRHYPWPQVLGIVLALNALTHPIVFFGLLSLGFTLIGGILVAEPFAFLVEAAALAYFARLTCGRALAASFLANLVSWQFGSLLTYWLLAPR